MRHDPTEPTLIDVPLSVDVVDGEIFLDGSLPVAVSLTSNAALETGISLINAALALEAEAKDPEP